MNTKVEEALGVLDKVIDGINMLLSPEHARWNMEVRQARTALAARIAQQDATIARMFTREQVAEMMRGMVPDEKPSDAWSETVIFHNAGHNTCRTETLARIEAWQNQEQGK